MLLAFVPFYHNCWKYEKAIENHIRFNAVALTTPSNEKHHSHQVSTPAKVCGKKIGSEKKLCQGY